MVLEDRGARLAYNQSSGDGLEKSRLLNHSKLRTAGNECAVSIRYLVAVSIMTLFLNYCSVCEL